MNKTMNRVVTMIALAVTITACTKKDMLQSPTPAPGTSDSTQVPKPTPPTATQFAVLLKGYVEVGNIMYDSIATAVTLTSWDSTGISYVDELSLLPGTNTVNLEKKYTRFQFSLHTWGVTQTLNYTREQLQEGSPVILGGKREAKQLRAESTGILVGGAYRPESKIDYYYNSNGSLSKIDYYQKRPQGTDLNKYWTDHFYYKGQQVIKINRHDDNNKAVVFTDFDYTSNGDLVNVSQDSYGDTTYGYVRHKSENKDRIIDVDLLNENGNAVALTMKFRGGNKIADNAISSTGGSESGTYNYDQHVNPYHQLNWPDMYFRNSSKNNPLNVDKGYSGNIPSMVVYKTVYTYDNDGYPKEVIKSFKGYRSGEHLFDQKTLYFY